MARGMVFVAVVPTAFLLCSLVRKLSRVLVRDWYLGRVTEDSVCGVWWV